MPRSTSRTVIVLLAIAILAPSCQVLNLTNSKPTVVVSAPPSGTQFNVGQDVAVTSTATDPLGITRVELLVDGLIIRTDPSPVAQGQAQFHLVQTWKASTSGTHTVTVRAYNTAGGFGEAGLNVLVNDSVVIAPTLAPTVAVATPLAVDTPASVPTSSGIPTLPAVTPVPTGTAIPTGCVPDSVFVSDVTIPDGSVLSPKSQFIKTWRIKNAGTCDWNPSYAILWQSGAQIGLQSAFPIPSASAGQTVDVSVAMQAPASPGDYTSLWRLRDSYGNPFGTNLTAVITVPSPNPPTAVPTKVPTPAGAAPFISSFNCSPCSITSGQTASLVWGLVSKATAVTIDQGIGGVATPGNILVSPPGTTTYTMTAVGPGGTTQRSVTITVNSAVGNFAGTWSHNFGTMTLTQNGAAVTGSYFNGFAGMTGTISGTVSGSTLDGTWAIGGGSGQIHWVLAAGGNQFTGNWDGTNNWCGARSGQPFPSGCSYAGTWNTNISCGDPHMTLQRVDMTVTGTYCTDRALSGNISYSLEDVILTGGWLVPGGTTGGFQFFLTGFGSTTFTGHYTPGTNQWCGWRTGSLPNPCYR